MEDLIQSLKSIVDEFNKAENITPEEFNALKDKEFVLFDKIERISELCEYCKTDMVLDKIDHQFISGYYSGIINGSMFVINQILNVISVHHKSEKPDNETLDAIIDKISMLQGLNTENEENNNG